MGAEFRDIDFGEAMRCVDVALDSGMNLIDTSPYYGRGLSEVLLGLALKDKPRDSYYLSTKLGRYAPACFDFSAKRVVESVEISLERVKTDYIDILFCHDIEFVSLDEIVEVTLPAIRKLRDQGKVRWIGVSGYPMKIFREILNRTELDVVLSYNHYTLQNTMLADNLEFLESKGAGILNAAPFSARLLTGAPLPDWHKATDEVRTVCAAAAKHCTSAGSDIAKLALQFSIAHPKMTTCVTGSANPNRVQQWCDWAREPIDESLLKEVLEILQPIHNWFYVEGLAENSDQLTIH